MSSHQPSHSVRKPPDAVIQQPSTTGSSAALVAIRVVHTVVWAIFAGCILAIPVATWRGDHRTAAWLAGIVFAEVAVLALNHWRCPLTTVAARYTDNRRANFDIYLPEWLARNNKSIFGTIYLLGLVFAITTWVLTAK